MNMQIDLEKGIANVGDVSRMKEVMARAKRGERLVIGFIGGSITQGSLSSTPQTCYAYRVYTWWKETFPQAEFVYCNAGIGGTTSEFGAARVGTDLLAERPDFVIVEFSVNDESTEHFKETYEGLVRKILGAAWNPAVLLVHNVFYHNGANAQVMHAAIGRHYDLPSVSMQSSIYPEVVAGRIANRAITPDDLHPNDEGHALVASVITYFLERVRSGKLTGSNARFTPGANLPVPLTKNAYEDSIRIRNAAAPDMAGLPQPTLDGFTPDETAQNGITDCFRYGWTAEKTGDAITFLVKGSCIAVQYRFRHPWVPQNQQYGCFAFRARKRGGAHRHDPPRRDACGRCGSVLSGVRDCGGEKRKRLTASAQAVLQNMRAKGLQNQKKCWKIERDTAIAGAGG